MSWLDGDRDGMLRCWMIVAVKIGEGGGGSLCECVWSSWFAGTSEARKGGEEWKRGGGIVTELGSSLVKDR